jgi:MFS family permease
VQANPHLALLAMSVGAWIAGEWAVLVGLSALAFADGGLAAVGIVGAAYVLPAAAIAPWAATVADRYPRARVLAIIHALWAVELLALGLLAGLHLPLLAVYAVVALGSVVASPFRPAVSALVPQLVERPEELTAANAVFGAMEAIGTLLGPVAAGALLAMAGPELVFLPLAVLYALGAGASLGIRTAFRLARDAADPNRLAQVVAGFGTLVTEPRARVIGGLFVAQTTMRGLLNVFVMSTAVTLLGIGPAGAGVLFSAIGLGGLLGAVLSLKVVAGRGLVAAFAGGVAAWGVAVIAMAACPNPVGVWLALAALGVGNAVEDVAGLALLQRSIPDHRLGRAFGALWGATGLGLTLGSLLAPLLIEGVGLRGAMALTGALFCLLVATGWAYLRRFDQPFVPALAIERLGRQPIFAPLPALALERLAHALQPQTVRTGDVVVRQDDVGERFYLVEQGVFRVIVDGREVRRLGPGEAFGETALLRQIRRTATIEALTDGCLEWLEARTFVPSVTGHWGSWTAASAAVDAHLARARPVGALAWSSAESRR